MIAVHRVAGKIESIIPVCRLPVGIERVDANGRWITLGLIDLHTHGALGSSDCASFPTR